MKGGCLLKTSTCRSETSASAASRRGQHPSSLFSIFGRMYKLRLFIVPLFIIALIGAGIYTYQTIFSGSTYASETVNIVEEVRDLSSLATAEAVITAIIKEEDNRIFNKEISVNFPGTKRTILLVVPATVLAGVNLEAISEEQLKIDEEKKLITLTLPHAEFLNEPSIQMNNVQTFSDEGLFRGEVKWDEGFDLAAAAQAQITEEAIKLGILEKAESNAVKTLSNLFHNLGYTAQIDFK